MDDDIDNIDDIDDIDEIDDINVVVDVDLDPEAILPRCPHYNRGCHLLYPCCNEYFACRFCHNDTKTDYRLDVKLMHEADRRDVVTVKCRYCLLEQDIANICINDQCKRIFGNYYCSICKLLDLDDKGQFHCDKCNICRQGGRENTVHCDNCGICVPIIQFEQNLHKCVHRIDGDCPICCGPLFESTTACTTTRCGHWLHSACLMEYSKFNNRCPVCSKSFGETDAQTAYIDHQIEITPMPDEYKDIMVNILCNDCLKKSSVKLHFYGLKCGDCNSYNTSRI